MFELIYNRIFLLLAIVLSSCYHNNTLAQEKSYVGKVINSETNQVIEGATIAFKPSQTSSVSKSDGTFIISSNEFPTLRISHINYSDTTITLNSLFQNIYLRPTANTLEEVIIRRNNINDVDIRNLVGSVTTIDMTKLSERSELDIGRLLEGQVPGLTVTFSGELGSRPQIRIRGNSSFSYTQNANEPLFVMDGVIISSETFMTLNAHDFQTIKVLKDAPATALYGIKAANGVIELTSKKGFNGRPIVNVQVNQGLTLRGERTAEMMGTQEKLAFEKRIEMPGSPGYINSEAYIRNLYGNSPRLEQELLNGAARLDSLSQYETDWFKELIRKNHFQTYNLGVRGGTEKSNYFYSTNYSKQGGRIPGNDINQLTARANLSYNLTPKFQLSINNSFGLSRSETQNGMDNDPSSLAFSLNPYETTRSERLVSYPNQSYADLFNQFKKRSSSKRFGSTLIAHWDLLAGLNISAVAGADYNIQDQYHRIYSHAFSMALLNPMQKGYLREDNIKDLNLSSNIRINYQKQFGVHDLYAGINMDYSQSEAHHLSGSGYGLADEIESLFGVNTTLLGQYTPQVSGSKLKNKQLGFGAAMGYTLQSTYDIYASLKRDGSSLLPQNKRWNDAWSVGIGWSPSEYYFFKQQDWISSLKIKSSIGYTASMAGIDRQDINPTFRYSKDFYGEQRILELQALANKQLNPQQTFSTNIAMDIGFFSRINILLNFYNSLTKEAILSIPIALSNGFKNYSQNIGELENKGLEITLQGDILRLNEWRWNTALSLSQNYNTVKKLYDTNRLFLSEQSVIPEYEVGKPLGIIYGVKGSGIHPITGIPEFMDKDNQSIDFRQPLQESYFRSLGYAIAPYTGFLNNYLSYKNWSLTTNINFSFGGIKKISQSYVRDLESAHKNAIKGQLDQMWFEIGDENKIYPSKNLPSNIYLLYTQTANTKGIYKTNFIKLNHIQLSYNFIPNPKLMRYLKSTRVSIQADNLYSYRIEKDRGSLNDGLQPVLTFSINSTF